MKKKVIGIVGTIITTILIAVCIIKVGGTFFEDDDNIRYYFV